MVSTNPICNEWIVVRLYKENSVFIYKYNYRSYIAFLSSFFKNINSLAKMCTCLENVLKTIGFRWLKIIVLNFQNKIDLTSLLPLLLNLVRTLLQFQMVRGISLTEFGWVNGVLQKNVF